jgi:hypothetical protein
MATNARGHRRYVENNRRLRDSLPPVCSWCGDPVDVTLPPTDPMSWTTDHTVALADGGDLYGERTLCHRRCNSKKERARLEGKATEQPLKTTRAW